MFCLGLSEGKRLYKMKSISGPYFSTQITQTPPLHTAYYRLTENFKPSSFNGECAQSHSGWHNLSSGEVRESTDFGNLSAVNLKPVTFEIGIDIMPHERKINHDLSSLTKFLLVQYQLKWFVSSVTREVFWATFEGSLIFKGNGPDVFWWRSWSYVFVFFS